jgi:hypothetical protein
LTLVLKLGIVPIESEGTKMGYELKMYVVEKGTGNRGFVFINGDRVSHCFEELGNTRNAPKEGHSYHLDGIPTPVPKTSIVLKSTYCSVLAMLDLCCCQLPFAPVVPFEKSDGCYMYENDGDTLVGLDECGDYRSFISLDTVLKGIRKANESSPYRRFDIAIALLKSVKKGFKSNIDNIGCLFYGH